MGIRLGSTLVRDAVCTAKVQRVPADTSSRLVPSLALRFSLGLAVNNTRRNRAILAKRSALSISSRRLPSNADTTRHRLELGAANS